MNIGTCHRCSKPALAQCEKCKVWCCNKDLQICKECGINCCIHHCYEYGLKIYYCGLCSKYRDQEGW